MEEYNHNYKKKIGIFATVTILADYLISSGVNMLVSHFTVLSNIDVTNIDRYKTVNQIVSVGLSVLSLVIIFIASYIFTKDKRKTVIFAGSIYFGKNTAAIISSLISAIAKSLTSAAILSPGAQSAIVFAGKFVSLPIMIALAYFAFTAFKGINVKLEGRSLGNSEMLFSQARNRYFAAYIINMVISAILTSGPSFIFAYATAYGIIDSNEYTTAFAAITQIISWLSTVICLMVSYFMGYKPYRNHIDGISFISVSGITGAVSALILNTAMLPLNMLIQSATNSQNYGLLSVVSVIASAVSLIAIAVDIILAIYIIKFFFSKSKISLFEEDEYTPVIESEENSDYSI